MDEQPEARIAEVGFQLQSTSSRLQRSRSHRPAWLRTAHELKLLASEKMVVMLDAEVEQLTNILSKTTELSGGLQPTGEIERMSSDALKAIEEASKEE